MEGNIITVRNFRQMIQSYRHANPEHRFGQALFNCTLMLHPKTAEKVRATRNDPFFADKPDDERILRFYKKLFEYDFFI